MGEFSRAQLLERREHRRTFPEACIAEMTFTDDEGMEDNISLEVEYEWEPIGFDDGSVIVTRPKFPEHFIVSDENLRIDLADQIGHRHRVSVKPENVTLI